MKKILKTCLNPKVLLGIGVVILLAYIFAPQLARYSWVLLFLACPLSMIFMMVAMNHGNKSDEKK